MLEDGTSAGSRGIGIADGADRSRARRGGSVRELSTIRYFDGFLGARIGPVSALCFHPSKTMLAVGATDSVLSLFGTPSR